MVKVFEYGYISVTINGIAFIFYIQLPKDLGNTFPRYFCKKKYFFIVNLGVLDQAFFKMLLTWKCVAGLLLNFIKTFFITFATVSQPFSVKVVIYNIIEHVCVCLFVCLSSRLKKINTTGAASVKPGEAREMIGAANLRQMKFCQMKFAK